MRTPSKPKLRRKASGINLAELKPEDFAPVPKEQMGKSLRKSVVPAKKR